RCGAPCHVRRRADGWRRRRDLPRRDAGDRPSGLGCAIDLRPSCARSAGPCPRGDCARGWRRARRDGGARRGAALETRRPPRAYRPSTSGNGFQRHADGARSLHRGGRAMNGDHQTKTKNLIAAVIDGAEDVRPLEGLVENTAIDPGAPFVPDALERLRALKEDDRAAFEALRAQLRKAGCRVTELDEAIAGESGDAGGRGPKQADILIGLAQSAELSHSPDGTGFADLDINGHRETWPIRAKGFRRWLARRFFEATQGAPSSEALASVLNVIEAKAHFDAPEREV